MKKILETQRLYLREIEQSDFNPLCRILQDDATMYERLANKKYWSG